MQTLNLLAYKAFPHTSNSSQAQDSYHNPGSWIESPISELKQKTIAVLTICWTWQYIACCGNRPEAAATSKSHNVSIALYHARSMEHNAQSGTQTCPSFCHIQHVWNQTRPCILITYTYMLTPYLNITSLCPKATVTQCMKHDRSCFRLVWDITVVIVVEYICTEYVPRHTYMYGLRICMVMKICPL